MFTRCIGYATLNESVIKTVIIASKLYYISKKMLEIRALFTYYEGV